MLPPLTTRASLCRALSQEGEKSPISGYSGIAGEYKSPAKAHENPRVSVHTALFEGSDTREG